MKEKVYVTLEKDDDKSVREILTETLFRLKKAQVDRCLHTQIGQIFGKKNT